MTDPVVSALNEALSGIRIAEEYDIALNLVGESYGLATADAKLEITSGKPSSRSKASIRVDSTDTIRKMRGASLGCIRRLIHMNKINFYGEQEQIIRLQNELSPYAKRIEDVLVR